ncbi:MAG: hypothetical protein HY259_05335 [Chloroflexi bacterium]|nr:hypothetical protein [Chloroflexota bacterium]
MDTKDIKDQLSAFAESLALDTFGIRLDYSEASIQAVERILADIHTDYRTTGSEVGLRGIALEFAAYIVKVIEHHFGPADWQRDDPVFGKDTFPLQWRGSTIYPYAWCLKRILDGPADNVWSKFQAIILNHRTSGSHYTI